MVEEVDPVVVHVILVVRELEQEQLPMLSK